MNLKINWAELSNVHPKQEEIVWVIWEDGGKVEIGLKRDVGLGEINVILNSTQVEAVVEVGVELGKTWRLKVNLDTDS